eukprot:gene5572-6136_t
MDEIDDLFADLTTPIKPSGLSETNASITNPTTTTTATTTATTTSAISMKIMEDELFALLGSPDDMTIPSNPISTITTTMKQQEGSNATPIVSGGIGGDNTTSSSNFQDTSDFLSWLEESPSKDNKVDVPLPTTTASSTSDAVLSEGSTHATAIGSDDMSISRGPDANTLNSSSPMSPSKEETKSSLLSTATNPALPPPSTPPPTKQSAGIVESGQKDILSPIIASPSNEANNSFFQEVFGSEEKSSPRSPMVHHSTLSTQSNFVENVESILASPFPDIGQLRGLIDEAGYLPAHLRVQVLLLLLTGSSLRDEEATHFTATQTEEQLYQELSADCETLVKAEETVLSDQTAVIQEMKDIIILFCQRRNLEYRNDYSRILLAIIGGAKFRVKKGLASSLFYSLATSFMPLLGLQYTALELAQEVVHRWLRLLLLYHCPALAQHLDRVLPGWEQPAKEASTAQAAKYSKLLVGANNLDLLEKELGLESSFEYDLSQSDNSGPLKKESEDSRHSSSNNTEKVISSAHPKATERKGVIRTSWIISFFAGCLPASEASKLLDWAVFNGERFAGLYFIVSLLTLHASSLIQMTATELVQWFDDIFANKKNWFKTGHVKPICEAGSAAAATHPVEEVDCSQLTWSTFTKGWIHATAVVTAGTPEAFREALSRTETWAVFTADRQRQALSAQLLAMQQEDDDEGVEGDHHGDFEDVFGGKDGKKKITKAHGDEIDGAGNEGDNKTDSSGGDDEEDVSQGKGGVGHVESQQQPTSLLNTASQLVKAIGMKLQGKFDNADNSIVKNEEDEFVFAQDSKKGQETICLWADPQEVLPCITSNQRRQIQAVPSLPLDVQSAFCAAVQDSGHVSSQSDSDRAGCCFFLSRGVIDAPFFFGIDCRSEEERQLGLFPKAYAVDPDIVTDGEALNNLMAMLAPLASTTHICLIGAGEEYYRWEFLQKRQKKRFGRKNSMKDTKELQAHVKERSNGINAVALYLIKKSFSRVSILDGGFIAAARCLTKSDSKLLLESALVDIQQRSQLYSMLGLPLPTTTTATPAGQTSANIKNAVSNLFATWTSSNATTTNSTQQQVPSTALASGGPSVPPTTQVSTGATSSVNPSSATSSSTTSNQAEPSKFLSGWGKSLSVLGSQSLDSIRKAVASTSTSGAQPPTATASTDPPVKTHSKDPHFGVDDEEDDGMGPRHRSVEDTDKINISRTDAERAQALAFHKMAGLKKGDSIVICRAELPGSILFPAHKVKTVAVSIDADKAERKAELLDGNNTVPKEKEVELPRYLVVSRERFLVLDARGGGVGSQAIVKSNRHLTELAKMTFRKKDPELITLHFLSDQGKLKPSLYRIKKHGDFARTLQKNMERFK